MAKVILKKLKSDVNLKELLAPLQKYGVLNFKGATENECDNSRLNAHIEYSVVSNRDGLVQYLNTNFFNNYELMFSPYSPSFYFYKDKSYGNNIEDICRLSDNEYVSLLSIEGLEEYETFELTTIYPGLLTGSGYNHPVIKDNKQDKDGFQLGFLFDHTTGLPIISGSSIKGRLHSIFKNVDLLSEVYNINENKIKNIFSDGITVFHDAYIVKTHDNNKDKIFGSDFITTHHSSEEMGEFKAPIPIKFLKILPEVTFRFQFKGEKELIELFKKIIIDFGLGAKTNVGYGQFKE